MFSPPEYDKVGRDESGIFRWVVNRVSNSLVDL